MVLLGLALAGGPVDRDALRMIVQMVRLHEPCPALDRLVDRVLEELEAPDAAARPDVLVRSLQSIADTPVTPELRRIAAPTLLLWGADDMLISADHAQTFAREIPGAQTRIIDSCGHCPKAALAEFLAAPAAIG